MADGSTGTPSDNSGADGAAGKGGETRPRERGRFTARKPVDGAAGGAGGTEGSATSPASLAGKPGARKRGRPPKNPQGVQGKEREPTPLDLDAEAAEIARTRASDIADFHRMMAASLGLPQLVLIRNAEHDEAYALALALTKVEQEYPDVAIPRKYKVLGALLMTCSGIYWPRVRHIGAVAKQRAAAQRTRAPTGFGGARPGTVAEQTGATDATELTRGAGTAAEAITPSGPVPDGGKIKFGE